MEVDFDALIALPVEQREMQLLMLLLRAEKEADKESLQKIERLLAEVSREKQFLQQKNESITERLEEENKDDIENIVRRELNEDTGADSAGLAYEKNDNGNPYDRHTIYDHLLLEEVEDMFLPKYETRDAKKTTREMIEEKFDPNYKRNN